MCGDGAYIILNRDDAKRLAAQVGDDAIRQFVIELRNSKTHRSGGLVLECGSVWDPLHRALTEGTLDPATGEFPLNHCVLGGRRLHQGPGFEAVLVRPDIVPHVADEARDIKRAELHDRFFQLDPQDYGQQPTEKDFDRIWNVFRQILQLFDDAAAERAAVLFTVERQTQAPPADQPLNP